MRFRSRTRGLVVACGCAVVASLGALGPPAAKAVEPPDGRGYEVVSPGAEKFGGGVGGSLGGGPQYVQVSPDGERALYGAYSPFGDADNGMGVLGFSLGYVASRTAGGWSSTFVTNMPQPPSELQSSSYFPTWFGGSEQLGRIFTTVEYHDTPGFTSGVWARDLLGGIAPLLPSPAGIAGNGLPLASSADGSHLVVTSSASAAPIPGAPTVTGSLLYDATPSGFALVNVDDSGQLLNETGASLASRGGGTGTGVLTNVPGAVSRDGSRIFFYSNQSGAGAGDPQQLYVRVDGSRTVEISGSQQQSPQSPQMAVAFAGASADGTSAFFASAGRLTDDAVGAGPFLYRYDLPVGGASGTLSLVAGDDHPVSMPEPGIADVLVSRDGRRVYWSSPDGGGTIFRHDAGASGSTVAVAGTASARLVQYATSGVASPADLTPDGRFLVFISTEPLLPGDPAGGQKLYRYDAESGSTIRVSAGTAEPASPYDVQLDARGAGGDVSQTFSITMLSDSNFVSDDGRYVFFQTSAPLVPGDTNGVNDVYRWKSGEGVALITDGARGSAAYLNGASADGRDVFFTTLSDLVAQDGDQEWDVYDARIGGGFASAARPGACAGDDCQGTAAKPPAGVEIGSDLTDSSPDRDETLPRLTIGSIRSRAKRALTRTGVLTVTVRGNGAGLATVRIDGRVGRRWSIGATTSRRLAANKSTSVRVRLPAAARLQLTKRHRALRVRVVIDYSETERARAIEFVARPVKVARHTKASKGGAR